MIADLLVAGWLAVAVSALVALRQNLRLMAQRGRPRAYRQTLVVVSINGVGPATGPFVERLMEQDHGAYRVVFALSSRDEPAYAWLRSLRGRPRPRVEIAIAGHSSGCSQDAWNQVVALDHLRPSDRLVVFAAPEAVPPRDLVSTLDWGVIDEGQPVLTAMPLVVPAETNAASFMVASISLSAAGAVRPGALSPAWRGATAMTPETLRRLDLRSRWRGAMSDDGEIASAAAEQGHPVATQRCLTLASPWSGGFREAIAFGRRQFMILRMHRPRAFWLGVPAALLPVAGGVAAMRGALAGEPWPLFAIAVILMLGLAKIRLRRQIVRRVLGAGGAAEQGAWLRFDWLARPLWWIGVPAAMAAALFGRRITLAGVTYAWTSDRGARIVDDRGR